MANKVEVNGTDAQSIIAIAGSSTSAKDLSKPTESKQSKSSERLAAWVHETARQNLTITELLHQRANIPVNPETKNSNSIIMSANASFG